MVSIPKVDELRKRKKQLEDEEAQLIEKLKEQYSDLYTWLVEEGIDLDNLKTHSANITAALVLTLTSHLAQAESPPVQTEFRAPPQTKRIEVDELRGLSEDEKAELVWERYGHIIEAKSRKYRVDPKLIFATIMIESNGNTYAIRHEPHIGDSSYGLGQLLYGTARGIGFEGSPQDLYDPEQNIELIARYHRRNMEVYGPNISAQDLTVAYNAGSPHSTPTAGHVDKFQRWYSKADNFVS